MTPPIAPIAATLRDGTVVEVFVLAGGATSVRVVTPAGDESVVDFTESDAELWSRVEERRQAAA